MAATAAGSASPSPPPPSSILHNTSFNLTRLTPLYSFNSTRLQHYAREFRDIVKGDVLRGVTVSTQPSDRARSALIRSCEWIIQNDLIPTETFDSLVIKLQWEDGGVFLAILLPNFTSSAETVSLGKRKRGSSMESGTEFTPLPLLLIRGPQPVSQQLITYLTTRFDCRATEFNVSASLLGDCLQGYLERVFQEDATPRAIERNLKLLQLVFSTPEPTKSKVKGALRKITLHFGTTDVQELYRRSPTMLESLAKHLKESTAISLSALTLIKVASAGVILDASGRLKLFEHISVECTKFIVGRLVALAAKEPLPL